MPWGFETDIFNIAGDADGEDDTLNCERLISRHGKW